MACQLKCRVRHVSIIPDKNEGSLGHILKGKTARIEPEPGEPSVHTQFHLEKLALVSLGGSAAESLLTGHKCNAGSQSDFNDAWDYLFHLTKDEDEIAAYFRWLRERAKTTLSSNWNWFAVETLANELLKRKYIGGKEVRKIIRQAWIDSIDHIPGVLKTGHNSEAEQISDHDGTLGFIDALQQKTKRKPSVDVRLDI
jgi:hypothetical protein